MSLLYAGDLHNMTAWQGFLKYNKGVGSQNSGRDRDRGGGGCIGDSLSITAL